MRSPLSALLVLAAGLVAGACTDARSPALTQPAEPSYSVSSSVTAAELKADLDALLREPSRTLARYKVSEVESDLRLGRSTAYRNAWLLTAIPVVEWKLKRIPPEKQELFLKVLCKIWTLFGERLVARGFPAVDLCKFSPETLKNSTMQVVFNDRNNSVVVADGNYAAFIRAGSLKNPTTGLPVDAVLYTALDIADQPAKECPFETNLDCYGNVFDRFTQPAVVADPPSTSVRCAADPHTSNATAVPTATVENRVIGYAFNPATGQVEFQPRDTRDDFGTGGAPGTCDNEEHVAIGPLGLDRDGIRNAFAWLGHSASRATRLFTPTTLYALNVPWHVADDLLVGLFGGDQVGMVDPVVRVASAQVSLSSSTIFADGTAQASVSRVDKRGGPIAADPDLYPVTWTSSNTSVATVHPNTGVVTGVSGGSAVITAHVGTGEGLRDNVLREVTASQTITVDPNADFRGIWNGTTRLIAPTEQMTTQAVTLIITNQTSTTIEFEYRIARTGETVAHNTTLNYTNSLVAQAFNLQLTLDPFVSSTTDGKLVHSLVKAVDATGAIRLNGTTIRTLLAGSSTTWETLLTKGDAPIVTLPSAPASAISTGNLAPLRSVTASAGSTMQ